MNIINRYLKYRDYKRNLKKIYPTLRQRYNFKTNYFNEFYTVLDLTTVPEQVKQEYGIYWAEHEINKFLLEVQNTVDTVNIHEELGIIEIKEIGIDVYGICFGIKRSIFNPKKHLFFKLLTILLVLVTITIIIL